ncbi:hydantoinase B/oxoprolinase family protein [Mesorhizobium sp. M2A.F.Ca.ET.067.02.1.1]|uniref:hydantoinase B/oxoprolinase family protein n=1 Tax=Mesorhizobium sp. M2A.F.Ca.ET.067.02.1.1 TaxID=2496749 RepID=UPI000FD26ECA|nr:hydantoinase B/oxoprolinase family protein [Mesorhizobium sp. M2A.F.Ca.ET.067.02.1.1]RUW76593.1 hydantoinase B/oxoprolinase family protein [Mesorhizobium sp. M2A.F.Ca.ET.067.02.1.1]TIU58029.1 MAG: hydantoinase B/oxoprolinase family protein [Mesorhizobium sp.]
MSLNPIQIEMIRNALTGICDEMYVAIMRSAYSTNIKERRDHSTAIFDIRGRTIVQGESLPLLLASMHGLVEVVLKKYGAEAIKPGDMFISNDPYVGRGSHLPDIAAVMPIFTDGRLVAFVADIAHHADVGGMVPGSMAGGMTEIYQEGLRIPPLRIMRDHKIDDNVMDLVLLNVRVPHERRGDYNAQFAANLLGARRMEEFFRRWTLEQFEQGAEAILNAVARRIRSGISELPDGKYVFEDHVDDDGAGTTAIPIKVEVAIKGDEIFFDFAGSSAQVTGNINVTTSGLEASVLYALKVLVDPDGPTNSGMMDPVTITAPEGSIVNARFPAATAARAQTCQRIIDVVLGALAQAAPQLVIAASNGSNTSCSFSGIAPDGKHYVYMETIGGGAGARAYKDGTDGVQAHVTNTSNLPIEALEREYPLLIERYEFVENSGGAGKWRGGLGLRRVYRPIGHTCHFSGQGERFVYQPWGLFGGKPGRAGRLSLVHDNGKIIQVPGKLTGLQIPDSARLEVETPGAGGYGNPAERNSASIEQDTKSGKISPEISANAA